MGQKQIPKWKKKSQLIRKKIDLRGFNECLFTYALSLLIHLIYTHTLSMFSFSICICTSILYYYSLMEHKGSQIVI